MKNSIIPIALLVIASMTSCVSTKKYKRQVAAYDTLKVQHDKIDLMLSACIAEKDQQSAVHC